MDTKKTHKRFGISPAVGTLVVVVVVVVVVGLLARENTRTFEKTVVAQAYENLQTIARTESQHIERRIIDTHDELRVLAENPKVKEALINGSTDKEGPVIDGYCPEKLVYEHLMGSVSSLYRLDNKGIVQSRFPWKKGKAGDDYSDKPGVKMVLKNHRPCVSDLFKSSSGDMSFSVCYPVFEKKQFIGILRAVINLDIIHNCVKDSNIGQKRGYAWILDDDGIVISHPESKYAGKNIITAMKVANPSRDWTKLQSIVARMTKGEKGVGFLCCISPWDEKLKDAEKLTAFVPVRIPNKQWSLGVVMEYETVSGPVTAHARNVGIGVGLLMLVFVGTGAWSYKAQKAKNSAIIKAQSVEKLRSLNKRLEEETSVLRRTESQLQKRMSEVEQGKHALMNMMTDSEQARKEAEQAKEIQHRFGEQLITLVEVANELTMTNSFDDLCRCAVELGQSCLGFERLGIWFRSDEPDTIVGSFGVDENGDICDERSIKNKLDPDTPDGRVLLGKETFVFEGELPIVNHRGKFVDQASQVFAGIWDGKKVIGHISMDNLITKGSITKQQCELLRLFAATVGYLGTRKRVEEDLQQAQQATLNMMEDAEQAKRKTEESNKALSREIVERKRAEKKLRMTHEKLVETSHRAGMAEVAADVLHNVGNVLNSVNVSTTLIAEKVSNSKVSNLKKVTDMVKDHVEDLGTFLTEDPKGRHIPVYLTKVVKLLVDEQADIAEKVQSLVGNIQHIKEIVNMQQSYARMLGVEASAFITEVLENAIQINRVGLDRHKVQLICEFAEIPNVSIDKQRVLQILVNLISNAKYALTDGKKEEKLLTVRFYKYGEDRLRIEVADNGAGISKENLKKIFVHGFTTKKDGHGFGLHSGALAAKEMGGSLAVHSDGPGHGATFTLELPFKPVEVME